MTLLRRLCACGVVFVGKLSFSVIAAADPAPGAAKSAHIKQDIYYQGFYWNDIPSVQREISRRSSGDENVDWLPYLMKWRNGRPFERILSLSCGDGSIERWLYTLHDGGGFKVGVGLDFLPELVQRAQRAAQHIGMNVTYKQHDINVEKLPAGPFDLVLVHAGAHHWGRVDFVMRQVASALTPDGLFVLKEFVGPHRNQYPEPMWQAALRANELLPKNYRNQMAYPHLPTMLHMDPSEAQHSELIMATIRRYFYLELNRPLCGALAYPVFTHNKKLRAYYKQTNVSKKGRPFEQQKVERAVQAVMSADAEYCKHDPEGRSLFSFIIARPLKGGEPSKRYRQILTQAELQLEKEGTRSTYYTQTTVATRIG